MMITNSNFLCTCVHVPAKQEMFLHPTALYMLMSRAQCSMLCCQTLLSVYQLLILHSGCTSSQIDEAPECLFIQTSTFCQFGTDKCNKVPWELKSTMDSGVCTLFSILF